MPVVTDFTELQAACQVSGTVQVANDITLSDFITIPNTADITLESLSGQATIFAPSTIHFYVLGDGTQGGGGSLTLQNITLDGNHTYGGIHIGYTNLNQIAGGTLILNAGSIVQNCYQLNNFYAGNGTIGMRGGILEMHDGAIIQNNEVGQGAGGGIDLEHAVGTTVYSKMTMTGGLITRNKAATSGGGINVTQGATCLMSGGTISYNAGMYGAGVNIDANISHSTFTMNTDTGSSIITHNHATAFGGGVGLNPYLDGGEATFNFQAGEISFNAADLAGGGIGSALRKDQTDNDGILMVNQTGGTIAHNTAPLGGGVFISTLDESEIPSIT